jgi:hypothetical protein
LNVFRDTVVERCTSSMQYVQIRTFSSIQVLHTVFMVTGMYITTSGQGWLDRARPENTPEIPPGLQEISSLLRTSR